MQIDQARIQAILADRHGYYGWHQVPIRRDARWYPTMTTLFSQQLSPGMRMLDVGCGNGSLLAELSPNFQAGVGVDHDPEHIRMAEAEKRARGLQNVDFLLLDFPREAERLEAGSFDLVVSQRGPLAETAQGIRAGLRLLRPEGLLFCEEIGEQHQHEVVETFTDLPYQKSEGSIAQQLKGQLEAQGVDVRLVADVFTKWIYPDVYAWFAYICDLWTWLDVPLPQADDPRIALFAERNASATGEIVTSHHVAWVAGVKPQSAPAHREGKW